MVDPFKDIESFDRAGMLNLISRFPEDIERALELTENIEIEETEIDNIIISGMGGSAISGDIIQAWLRERSIYPIYVNRDYDLPGWAGRKTLAIFLSYSGNTEETISSFNFAIKRGCRCISISSGGRLEEESRKRGIPHIKIPSGYQPRAAIAYLLFPCIRIFEELRIVEAGSEIRECVEVSREVREENGMNVELEKNPAKRIAKEIKDTLPNIYGWRHLVPVARRWRTQINENSKMIARFDEVPECNHNDVVGWTQRNEISSLSSCILLRDRRYETRRIRERFDYMKEIFEGAGARIVEVDSRGRSILARIVSTLYIGDFVSCYLALLRHIDPTPVEVIARLKERLSRIR
ncbi:MAG: bifunctional phosphoglucose/phosphomannose isomerase [Thermoplasmata archaeon]|nr:MAG: bifunctional phosphoglucose/phosphomannose isomerase [Thermoplasmata archaeon]